MAAEAARDLDRTGDHTVVERRGNVRHPTHAIFHARIESAAVMGGGRDISRGGAYFVTSDEISIEVSFAIDGKERRLPAKVVRMEQVAPGTLGIAVQFDRRLREHELP